jgi:putative ATP-dependent endonuclease of OLD family
LIEKPEAHLHPSAVRLFWRFLEQMPGQKIITTHSGDILANVPIENIRRIAGVAGENRVRAIDRSRFNPKLERYLKRYITYSRGELYFARIWLLVEGETEQTIFNGVLNHDGFLDRLGVRIIEYAQNDFDTFLILAEQIGMNWFLVSDGDSEGKKYNEKALEHIATGQSPDDRIIKIDESTLEVHLMMNGFGAEYEGCLSDQTRGRVSGTPGTIEYFESVYKAIKNSSSKPQIAVDIVEKILSGATAPPILANLRTKLEALIS